MNLYLLTQDEETGYDTFDSVVVAALNGDQAKKIHPYGDDAWGYWSGCWPKSPEGVDAKLIGKAVDGTSAGVILSSFNAG